MGNLFSRMASSLLSATFLGQLGLRRKEERIEAAARRSQSFFRKLICPDRGLAGGKGGKNFDVRRSNWIKWKEARKVRKKDRKKEGGRRSSQQGPGRL